MDRNQEKTTLSELIRNADGSGPPIVCTGLTDAACAYLVSRIYHRHHRPMVWIAATAARAERCLADLRFFAEADDWPLLFFPPYNILPFKRLSYHAETSAERVRVLYGLINGGRAPILVTTVQALMQKLVPRSEVAGFAELVMTGEDVDLDPLLEQLVTGGYTRTLLVEEPGDFAVRGGIVDVFSPMYDDPLRIEFYGDTVESIRFFSAATQRKLREVDEAVILPAKETILGREQRVEVVARIRALAAELDLPKTMVRDLAERVHREGVIQEIESLLPLVFTEPGTLFDYLSTETVMVLDDPVELAESAADVWHRISEGYTSARASRKLCLPPQSLYMDWNDAAVRMGRYGQLIFRPLTANIGPDAVRTKVFDFSVQDNTGMHTALEASRGQHQLFAPLAGWLEDRRQEGLTTAMVCRTSSQADRLQSLLSPYGVSLHRADRLPQRPGQAMAYLCPGQLSGGFIWPEAGMAVMTEDEVFGARRRRQRRKAREIQTGLLAMEDLKAGDLVVHQEHGIGCYQGLTKLTVEGATDDFLLIVYKDEDRLYLPVVRMGLIQKYMGVDGIAAVLDKMGGRSWDRVKDRVKASAQKIAGELLHVYAARKVRQGHAFRPVDDYFRDFETGFAYEETPDQLKAIDDVLQGMMAKTPMDRLVCGDVGYGKTEVALRAAFMAVNDGRQVAVLVPTTVLAEQHFATFSGRFSQYPVKVACLSRFRSAREQRDIISGLSDGRIDIVIGTHRLLQKDVAFKSIGLLVLDEEQRFGVRHKEMLKKLRETVDVLAMTATPIPRTLHMSLVGVRDISIISTPPEHRQAIITYVCEFDEAVAAEAIRRELVRGGQVFFVHNIVHGIDRMAGRLSDLVPEARVAVAHGQMGPEQLEKVMLTFARGETDLLVCTTIIESGLDIPSANTLLVNRADRFGLAQMYQLRGRVGRGDAQAYAYLFIPPESVLSRDAQKRLRVLMEHSDLGSGFQIAMSDLKIRGGGSILGASQSGHIAAVGYDMFLQLMASAVSELKGEPVIEALEPEINVPMSAFLPEDYIPDIDQRLAAYRRLARMNELREIADFKIEMLDRFGPLPEAATNLLLKIMLRVQCLRAGAGRLDLIGQQLILGFSSAHQRHPQALVELVLNHGDRFRVSPDQLLRVRLHGTTSADLLAEAKQVLKEIAAAVNE
ncbi:MAG: transcription-repair coupling factor [Desulfobacterales bacterium]|nr:transcription-repair coupling factor [Desulfobacterales bacterium]